MAGDCGGVMLGSDMTFRGGVFRMTIVAGRRSGGRGDSEVRTAFGCSDAKKGEPNLAKNGVFTAAGRVPFLLVNFGLLDQVPCGFGDCWIPRS